MSPEAIGLLLGLLVLIITRVLDFFLPRNWHFRGLKKYATKVVEPATEESEDGGS